MRSLESFGQILLYRLPVDGRKQINGLAQIVKDEIGDPFSASLFVFVSKRHDLLRILYWDNTGFAMWVKRLEKDRFRWPLRLEQDVASLTAKELSWLLDGIDILRTKPHEKLSYSSL